MKADAGTHPKVQRWDLRPGVGSSTLARTALMLSGTMKQVALPASELAFSLFQHAAAFEEHTLRAALEALLGVVPAP